MPHNPSLMSPPDDVYLISNKVKIISLLFATDAEYVSFPCIMSNYKEIMEVTAIVRQSLTSFIMQVIVPTTPNTENNPVVSFDILFCQPGEISKGNGQTLPHPESIVYLLFLHQLVYKKANLKFPTEAELASKSKQQI